MALLFDTPEIQAALRLQGSPVPLIEAAHEAADAFIVRQLGEHPVGQQLTWEWNLGYRSVRALKLPQECEVMAVRWQGSTLAESEYVVERQMLRRYFEVIPWFLDVEADVRLPNNTAERKQAILELIRIGINRQGVESQRVGNVAGNTWITFGDQDLMVMRILDRISPSNSVLAGVTPHKIRQLSVATDRVYVGTGNVNLVGNGINWGQDIALPTYQEPAVVWYAQQTDRADITYIGFGSTTVFNQISEFTKHSNSARDDQNQNYDVWISEQPLNISGFDLTIRR